MENKMKNGHVRIWIPICNDMEKVKRTINSIKNQTYDVERIEVIAVIIDDISETLYGWLLGYSLPHLAIYKKNGIEREIQVYREINELSDSSLRMDDEYVLELQAGDVLFPDMIEKCVSILEGDMQISSVVCESNICQKNGEIIYQKPLYDKNILLDHSHRLDRLVFGYFHRIFCFSRYRGSSANKNFGDWLSYDVHFWNFSFFKGADNTIMYLRETVGVVDSTIRKLDCSLKKLIAAHVGILQFTRLYEYSAKHKIDIKEQDSIWRNYAYMSLAMVCQLALQEEYIEAENCLLYSKAIWLPIEKTEIYNNIKRYLQKKDFVMFEKLLRVIIEDGGKDFE